MFNIDRDVVVTYSVGRWGNFVASSVCQGISIITQDPLGLLSIPDININGDTVYSIQPYFLQSAVGDFNQDGYEDILIIKGGRDSSMFVLTAEDPDVPELGLKLVGPFELFPSTNGFSAMNAMSSPVIGDFNGDTITDVAWVGSRASNQSVYNIFFASICPGPTAGVPLCDGKQEFEIVLNPLSSQTIALNIFTDANAQFAYPASALAAGDFNLNPDMSAGDDLLVVYGRAGSGGWDVLYYTFNDSMTPTLRDSTGGTGKIWNVYGDSAQLDRTQPGEQAVMALQTDGGCPLWVFTFDDKGFILNQSNWELNNGACYPGFFNPSTASMNGMAIGRFTDEIPQTAIEQDPQIAVFISDNISTGGNAYRVRVFEARQSNNFIAKYLNQFPGNSNNLISYFGDRNPNRGGSFIRAGDLQGRSLLLGAPSVVRMPKFTQVDVIQGSPPMHGDYVQTLDNDEPVVNNFSVIPETFNTAFTTQTSSTTSSTERSTSSYTYSFMAGVDIKAKYPIIPLLGGEFQFALNLSAEQLYDCNVSEVNTNYSSKTFGLKVVSGFGDQIIFTQQRQNVYYYPVIGTFVCPDGTEICSDLDKKPLELQFSAPDQIYKERINEINAEFYQPVHEPGNIFTYPWTTAQLLSRFGSVPSDLLTPANPVGWFTDTSATTEFADWTQGTGNECTTETEETLTFNESLSLGYGNSQIESKRKGINVKFNFDFSQSSSNGSMLSNISMLSDSTGVSTVKTNSFIDPPNYQYRVQTYIFGEKFPAGVWDTSNPEGDEANINSTGALKVAYAVNPTISGAGNWWQSGPGANPYKAYPDLALNHPNLWRITGSAIPFNQEPPSNCRPNTINENRATCLLKRPPVTNPSQLWANGFYQMRGLIVQVGEEATGPQIVSSVVGDDVHLTARIYNNSFKNFDAGTLIKVQFYRQQWDPVNVVPIGDSILIDQVTTTPVPAFNVGGTSTTPNWKTVSTTFNTEEEGMEGDTWWIFWILAWPQHHEGNVVTELPGHGLPAGFHPGEIYKSILDVPLEIVNVIESGQNVQTSFTNNLGFWKQAFYVAPRTIAEEPVISADLGKIAIDNLTIEKNDIFVDDEILVEADIRSIGTSSEALAVTLDEGHPDDTDQIYDIEVMSHIAADSSNKFRVTYQPTRCGERDLYLSAGPEGPSAPTATMASIPLNVICRPGDTNIDGKLIGNDGQPVSIGGGNCSLAPYGSGSEIPVYLFVPLILAAFVFGFRILKAVNKVS